MPSAAQMRQMAADEKKRQEEESKEPEAKKPQSASPPLTTELPAPSNEITTFTLPGTSIDVPVPRAEIVSTAVITAGASSVAAVAGTLAAGQVLQYLQKALKPLMTRVLKNLARSQGRSEILVESDARQKWRQRGRKVYVGRNRV